MDISDRAMLVQLNISQWTAKKYDKTGTKDVCEQHKTATDWAKVQKRLVASEALDQIRSIATEARMYHYAHTLPWQDGGARLLTADFYLKYTEAMRGFKAKFESAAAQFCKDYQTIIQSAPEHLGSLYNAADYPAPEVIAEKFGFTIETTPIPTGDDFRVSITDEAIREVRDEMATRLQERIQFAMRDLFERLAKSIKKLAETLSDNDAIFHNSLIDNVKELCELLPDLNVTKNAELECTRKEVLAMLKEPEVLRDDPATRADTARQATAILEKMSVFLGKEK